MTKIQLDDTTKYVRDGHSKAIISSDNHALAAYNAKRAQLEEFRSYGKDINMLKDEMVEIKSLLLQILNNQGREA
jgi:hypothetical protein